MYAKYLGTIAAAGFIAGASLPGHAVQLLGYGEQVICCGTGSAMRLIGWDLSMYGTPWVVRADGVPQGGFTNFPPSVAWAPASLHGNETLEMDLVRSDFGGGTWQPLEGHLQIHVGGVGTPSPANVHSFTRQFSGPTGSGLNVQSSTNGTFVFTGVSAATPLYWGIEWKVVILNPDDQPGMAAGATLAVNANALSPDPLPPLSFNLDDMTLSGSWFGVQTASDYFTLNTNSDMGFFSGGSPFSAAGLLYEVRVAFSETPFDDIPDAVTAVPEPSAGLLVGVGLIAFRAFRRRFGT